MAQVYLAAARVEFCRRHAGDRVPPLSGEAEVRPSGEQCELEPFHPGVNGLALTRGVRIFNASPDAQLAA